MEQIKEGMLYKNITLHGKTFEIRYGYYEEYERESAFGEPLPIYPDFLKDPVYTDEGHPFVTQMQELCQFGISRYSDGCCADCAHYVHGDEMIGTCRCEENRRVPEPIA
ncbi:MAG: hypothetical protein IJW16_08415 [Clostridia bacterium]|nr:hypothetical protein [Clostridia bacterium]